MTISVQITDSAQSNGFQHVQSMDISVLSIIADRHESNISSLAVLGACIETLRPMLRAWMSELPIHRLILFAATSFWSNPNALERRRRFWGREDAPRFTVSRGPYAEVEVSRNEGTRFAGLAEIGDEDLFTAANYVRTHRSGVLFVSHTLQISEDDTRSVFSYALPDNRTDVAWSSLIRQFCQRVDYWYPHGVSAFSFGNMWQATVVNGVGTRFHSANQAQVEFLCDLAEFPTAQMPASVLTAARTDANNRAQRRFINGPGFMCGNPRPW